MVRAMLVLFLFALAVTFAALLVLLCFEQSASAGTITATWVDTSTGEDGFSIESGPSITGPFAVVGQVGRHVQVFTETDHYAGPQVCYRVRAFIGAAHSLYSDVACVDVPPASDEQVAITCNGSEEITVSCHVVVPDERLALRARKWKALMKKQKAIDRRINH